MRARDARAVRGFDLRAELRFDVRYPRSFDDLRLEKRQISVGIDEARNGVAPEKGSPAKRGPLAVQCEMDAEACLRVRPRERHHLGKPWARHHDARGRDPSMLQCLNGGSVHRM